MGAMKRNLLFAIALTMFFAVPVMAAVTVEETTDAEYLINAGYSQATAEDVFMMKNRVNGRAIEPLYDKPQSAFVRGWRKFYAYLDPSIDNEDRLHHDIQLSPSSTDL